jgi:hypothetical protein
MCGIKRVRSCNVLSIPKGTNLSSHHFPQTERQLLISYPHQTESNKLLFNKRYRHVVIHFPYICIELLWQTSSQLNEFCVSYESVALTLLTPELNSSAQRCLTRFFTGDFAS